MRVPVVAGVGGGVGTTIVAAALRAHDAGRAAGRWPDILVCRGTVESLRRAAAVVDDAGPEPPPVLAVTLDTARVFRGPLRAHLDLLEPGVHALVPLPHVRRWTMSADPLAEATSLLVEPPDRLSRPLRAYAAALRQLVEAVAASGRLEAASGDGHAGRLRSAERTAHRNGTGVSSRSIGLPLPFYGPPRGGAGPGSPAVLRPQPLAAPPVGHPRDMHPGAARSDERVRRPRGVRIVPPDDLPTGPRGGGRTGDVRVERVG